MSDLQGLFHEPLGVDFSQAFVSGLTARLGHTPPEALARVTILVNTTRMGRRIQAALAEGGATLLPRIKLVSDIAGLLPPGMVPAAPSAPLSQRFDLMRLVRGLLEQRPDLSPPSAAFDLAGSLANLLAEMQEEGVRADDLNAADLGDLAEHWARSWDFLKIIKAFDDDAGSLTNTARQLIAHDMLADLWAKSPPKDPIIVAGSTASRGPTRRLMGLILQQPQGAVVLPGMDADTPPEAWDDLTKGETPLDQPQDHPQYRHAALLDEMGLNRDQCPQWSDHRPAVPARNRIMSLALRPAPATDAWRREGPALEHVTDACKGITLLHAASPGAEATAIALGLRDAVERGKRGALISPDRTLTRQVAAQLGRWGIVPDDSAGVPLVQSSPGRFAMQTANIMGTKVEAEPLAILLSHPLTHAAGNRQPHLKLARQLELDLLRGGPCPFPDRAVVTEWGGEEGIDDAWAAWLCDLLDLLAGAPPMASLFDHATRHRQIIEMAVTGSAPDDTSDPWSLTGGAAVLAVLDDLTASSPRLDDIALPASEYGRILHALLSAEEMRDTHSPHRDVMIWGALEARARSADLVILGGLNEGTWPALPGADPWLNRSMRATAGLRLPDRVIGLSAHDFQQAASGADIWLSRSVRNSEAETVPSRWLNRLEGLLGGIGDEGKAALKAMHERGRAWADLAVEMAEPQGQHLARPAPRPAPIPPRNALPKRLSVTQIETLIRDPYAIYAKKVLGLYALQPLRQGPDARIRGAALHDGMEAFGQMTEAGLGPDAADILRKAMDEGLGRTTPWPGMRRLWLGRFERVFDAFLVAEAERRAKGKAIFTEEEAHLPLDEIGLTLVARADRLDERADGIAIYDYKTSAPTEAQQKHFQKQLFLEALMASEGAFTQVGRKTVVEVAYLQIGSSYDERATPVDAELIATTRDGLAKLWRTYRDGAPFRARLAPEFLSYESDYDHLSRFGEWNDTMPAQQQIVGQS